jgi:hypothetical protein
MRHAMNFHPEWGCLAPAPSYWRGQVDGSATNELRANSPARLAVVAASAEVGTAPEGTLKTAVAPSPATQKHSIQVAQRARHKDAVTSRQTHSVAPQTAPKVAERFFSGLTAAIEHVWPPQRLPANRTLRASGNNPSGSLSYIREH